MKEDMQKKDFPLFSILIPTYNQEKYIMDAVKSSLMQNYPNLEVIVSDDCSNDSTSVLVNNIHNPMLSRECR